MKKEEKQRNVEILMGELKDATGIYLVDFTGLNAQEFRKLRSMMRSQNIKIKVIKNIIARMTLERLNLKNLLKFLEGPTAVSYSYEDPILPSKILKDFSKEKEVVIKGGIVDGSFFSSEEIKELAIIPSREVLLQRLLFALSNPLQRLRNTLCYPIQNITGVLTQLSKKQS
ncbi:50S ribosomal protein L10 [candidate division WOR-3 bacterium]|nr:50S ribosomal protein L10 [candidate division WOR-3 bacterium]